LTVADLQDPVISTVSFVVDGYGSLLRDLIRESDDLLQLESRIPTILGQFLAQYDISANRQDVDHSHQDQVNILPLSSGLPEPSLEVESTTQPASDHSNGSNDDNWLQHDDFVISVETMYGDRTSDHHAPTIIGIEDDMFGSWVLTHDTPNSMSIRNDMLDLTQFEKGLLGSTSSSLSYEVLRDVL
jgi:hypothetical protein